MGVQDGKTARPWHESVSEWNTTAGIYMWQSIDGGIGRPEI